MSDVGERRSNKTKWEERDEPAQTLRFIFYRTGIVLFDKYKIRVVLESPSRVLFTKIPNISRIFQIFTIVGKKLVKPITVLSETKTILYTCEIILAEG